MNESIPSRTQPPHAARKPRRWLVVKGTRDMPERQGSELVVPQNQLMAAALPSDVRKAFGLPRELFENSGLCPALGRSPVIIISLTEAQSASAHRTAKPTEL